MTKIAIALVIMTTGVIAITIYAAQFDMKYRAVMSRGSTQ